MAFVANRNPIKTISKEAVREYIPKSDVLIQELDLRKQTYESR